MRAFIIDDNNDIRSLFSDVCEQMGFESLSFSNPTEIGNLLSLSSADIVITDLHMPYVTGIEFAKKIVHAGFNHKNIAVVSGFWDEINCSCAKRLGIQTFSKPVPIKLLMMWLQERLNQKISDRFIYSA